MWGQRHQNVIKCKKNKVVGISILGAYQKEFYEYLAYSRKYAHFSVSIFLKHEKIDLRINDKPE